MTSEMDTVFRYNRNTALFDELSERGIRKTPRGMAFWSGTGPPRNKCHDCGYFCDRLWGKGRCHRFTERMPKFSGCVLSCKYYEPSRMFPKADHGQMSPR